MKYTKLMILLFIFTLAFQTFAVAAELTGDVVIIGRQDKSTSSILSAFKSATGTSYTDKYVNQEILNRVGIDIQKDFQFGGVVAGMGAKGLELKGFIAGTFSADLLVKEIEKAIKGKGITLDKFQGKTIFVKDQFKFFIDDNFITVSMNSDIHTSADAYSNFMKLALAVDTKNDLNVFFRFSSLVKMIIKGKVDAIPNPMTKELINDVQALQLISNLDAGDISLTAQFADGVTTSKYHGFLENLEKEARKNLEKAVKGLDDNSKTANIIELFTKISNQATLCDGGYWILDKIKYKQDGNKLKLVLNFPEFKESIPVLVPMVAVGGVLAAIAIPNFNKARGKARSSACVSNMRVLEGAMEMFDMDGGKINPGPIENGLGQELVEQGYIKKVPTCKEGGKYTIVEDSQGIRYIRCSVHGTVDEAMNK